MIDVFKASFVFRCKYEKGTKYQNQMIFVGIECVFD